MIRLFLKRVISTLGSNGGAILILFAATVVITRALGPTGRGILALVGVWVVILTSLANLGISQASIYFTSSEKYEPAVVLGNTMKYLLVAAVGIGLLGSGAILAVGQEWAPNVAPKYLFAGLATAGSQIAYTMLSSIVLGLQRLALYNTINLVRALLFLVLFFALHWSGFGPLRSAIFSEIGALLITSLMLLQRLFVAVGRPSFRPVPGYFKEAVNYGLPAILSGGLMVFHTRIGIWLIGRSFPLAETGLYSVGIGLCERFNMISNTISTQLFPFVARHARDTKEEFADKIVWMAAAGVSLMVPILSLVAPLLISTIYGPRFLAAAFPFQVLLVGALALNIYDLGNSALQGHGLTKPGLVSMGAGTIVTFLVSHALMPVTGMIGAALGFVAGSSVAAVGILFSTNRFRRSNPSPINQPFTSRHE